MHDDELSLFITKNGYIDLSPCENFMLKFLLENKNKVITYDDFCVYLYCKKRYVIYDEYYFKSIISRLRRKLKGEVEIKTKHGIGYYID
jgi:DNA-binding response OmpR family regulator